MSFAKRTRPEFYAKYVDLLRENGCSEEHIAQIIARDIATAEQLLQGKCPKCGAPIARYVDYKRQQGVSEMPGMWVQYRCSTQTPPGQRNPPGTCDFMIDLKDGEASN